MTTKPKKQEFNGAAPEQAALTARSILDAVPEKRADWPEFLRNLDRRFDLFAKHYLIALDEKVKETSADRYTRSIFLKLYYQSLRSELTRRIDAIDREYPNLAK